MADGEQLWIITHNNVFNMQFSGWSERKVSTNRIPPPVVRGQLYGISVDWSQFLRRSRRGGGGGGGWDQSAIADYRSHWTSCSKFETSYAKLFKILNQFINKGSWLDKIGEYLLRLSLFQIIRLVFEMLPKWCKFFFLFYRHFKVI
jgi:hypothetical protein